MSLGSLEGANSGKKRHNFNFPLKEKHVLFFEISLTYVCVIAMDYIYIEICRLITSSNILIEWSSKWEVPNQLQYVDVP